MANSRDFALRMLENLSAAFNKRIHDSTIRYYLDRLERLNLPEHQWASATSAIVGACTDTSKFPSLPEIQKALLGANYGREKEMPMITFQLDGRCWAYATRDLSNPKCPPEQATDLHLIIPWQQQARTESVPFSVGILIARQAFFDAGGRPSDWARIESSLKSKPSQERQYEPTI